MKRVPSVATVATAIAVLVSCLPEEEPIVIVDRTGKEWDITHAVSEYGFTADGFQFGIGPYAIPPIIDPLFLSPGDPGYPSDNETFEVLGVEIDGDARAYPITLMKREVVDDWFGDTAVAVAY